MINVTIKTPKKQWCITRFRSLKIRLHSILQALLLAQHQKNMVAFNYIFCEERYPED